MNLRLLRLWFSLLTLVFTVGCFRAEADGDGSSSGRKVDVTVSAQYEKRLLGPNGFGGSEWRPIRNCVVELRYSVGDSIADYAYLDDSGRARLSVPEGRDIYALLWAYAVVPGSKTSTYLIASVKDMSPKGPNTRLTMKQNYKDIQEFNNLLDAFVKSETLTARAGQSFALSLPASYYESTAFNIADQMVTFAKRMNELDPTLPLPDMAAFWGNGSYTTESPTLALDATNAPLRQKKDYPPILQFTVRSALNGMPATTEDGLNDSQLQLMLCRSLFADQSNFADGQRELSTIRRDHDDTWVSRRIKSDPALAFTNGFSDFLSCAFRGGRSLTDFDEYGAPYTFYLDDHAQFPKEASRGELYSGSVAISLYGIWKNTLGGSPNGLQQLYNAAVFSKGPREYNNTILASYPTFLQGLKNQSGVNWSGVLSELGRESIGDVTTESYFSNGPLWTTAYNNVIRDTLTLTGDRYFFDYDHQKAYRFVQASTMPRRFTLSYGTGQDMYLELLNTNGLTAGSWNTTSLPGRELNFSSLPAGEYLIRVRAGYKNSATGTANFTLNIQ